MKITYNMNSQHTLMLTLMRARDSVWSSGTFHALNIPLIVRGNGNFLL